MWLVRPQEASKRLPAILSYFSCTLITILGTWSQIYDVAFGITSDDSVALAHLTKSLAEQF